MSTSPSSCSTVPGCWACSPVAHCWSGPPPAPTWSSPERTEELARAQYRSLQRLAELDDDVAVWPTHGAGSFCSAPPGAERTSTIGTERATNALLRAGSEDVFVKQLLDSLGSFPPYFLRLGEINRARPGPRRRATAAAPVAPRKWHALQAAGADRGGRAARSPTSPPATCPGRCPSRCGRRSPPGSAGWSHADMPLVIVRNPDQDPDEILWQARKIGYDRIAGELDGGIAAWTAAGQPTSVIPLVDAAASAGAQVLDIRQDNEYAAGHVPGRRARRARRPRRSRLADLPPGPTVVMCGHGERAMSAASLLERAGRRDVAVLDGGPDDWAEATGQALESEP